MCNEISLKEKERLRELTSLEREAYSRGFSCVVGVDEVGRGPLAGPVVSAACFITPGKVFCGINDSKKLTKKKRRELYNILCNDKDVVYALGIATAEVIDKVNILEATKETMKQAVFLLSVKADYLLIDGLKLGIEGIIEKNVIKGDCLSQSIAAASIIAKEFRDQIMEKYHTIFPNYGFSSHKGYGTLVHREALKKYGVTSIHRKSFVPVTKCLEVF